MISDSPRHRLGLLAIAGLSLFGALFARLWFLQLVEGPTLEEQVTSNAQRVVVIPAPRGQILDRQGVVLVDNRESVAVSVDAQAFADLDEAEQGRLVERLSSALSRQPSPPDVPALPGAEDGPGGEGDGGEAVTVEFIERRLADQRFSRFRPIPVAEDITVEQEIYFREQAERFPSVIVERRSIRAYPYGSLAAHVLGYVGAISEEEFERFRDEGGPEAYERSDEIGRAGVEATYESYLRGTPGQRVFEVDRRNRVVRELTDQRVEPVPGDDVHLSLDARIQYKTEEALQARILEADAPFPSGAATVLDPRNGQVWAMASYPTYDPAALVGGISQDLYDQLTARPELALSNRNIQEAYPAASTFKLATSHAGLELGIIEPDEVIDDPGYYELCPGQGRGCRKSNSGGTAMGQINLSTALARSSNVYYFRIGHLAFGRSEVLGEQALQDQISVLGYGERTGIDLTAESAGRVPTPESNAALADALWEADPANYGNDEGVYQDSRRWQGGNNADVAIGEFDTLVTPLQNANAYASVVNQDGRLYEPSVLSHITDHDSGETVHRFDAEVLRTIDYGPARLSILQGLERVVSDPLGTAHGVFADFPLDRFPVGGKTGTASIGIPGSRPDNSLFVGYGPTPDPQYVASVHIEGGGFGSLRAAPVAAMVFEPIADGSLEGFVVPPGGAIDAQRALDESQNIGVGTAD